MKLAKLLPPRLKEAIANLSIAKKIGYGYGLSIVIALMGSGLGIGIGNFYQERARQQWNLVDEQRHLLQELEIVIFKIHFHPQDLLAVLEDPVWFEYEKSQFRQMLLQVKEILLELNIFVKDNSAQFEIDMVEFGDSLDRYRQILEAHDRFTHNLWEDVGSMDDRGSDLLSDLLVAEKQIVEAIRGEEALQLLVEFEKFSKHLNRIQQISHRQAQRAQKQFEQSKILRIQIIVASILLSTTMAVVLAIMTIRAIARPIHSVTAIAREVTEKEDFDLRSPVFGQDEVGILATSLNQMIQWAKDYTWEIEFARLTLEHRVEERTQELQQILEDLQQTQAQLIQSEKMSSLGQLVAGIAHEINNPVSFIYGNLIHLEQHAQDLSIVTHAYQKQYPNNPPELDKILRTIDLDFVIEDLPKLLDSMKVGADRIKAIVLSLRNFSRLDEANEKYVNLHEGLDSTLLILNHRFNDRIEIVKQYGNIPEILCCPAQLNQVFMNVITNAIDALISCDRHGKQISIATQTVDEEWIEITIADNGLGMPEETRERIFDPFFTTKPIGKGTGLGLSVSYQIVVEKHRGKLTCYSTPGEGTEFVIAIPIVGAI